MPNHLGHGNLVTPSKYHNKGFEAVSAMCVLYLYLLLKPLYRGNRQQINKQRNAKLMGVGWGEFCCVGREDLRDRGS